MTITFIQIFFISPSLLLFIFVVDLIQTTSNKLLPTFLNNIRADSVKPIYPMAQELGYSSHQKCFTRKSQLGRRFPMSYSHERGWSPSCSAPKHGPLGIALYSTMQQDYMIASAQLTLPVVALLHGWTHVSRLQLDMYLAMKELNYVISVLVGENQIERSKFLTCVSFYFNYLEWNWHPSSLHWIQHKREVM